MLFRIGNYGFPLLVLASLGIGGTTKHNKTIVLV